MNDLKATHTLDLKGVACPLNFVKTKLKLEEMRAGEILEVTLDEGEPIQMVPRSVKEEGDQVLAIDRIDEKHYKILIRKAV
jgi:tRNA 2-thiouridine synthesizing protein A